MAGGMRTAYPVESAADIVGAELDRHAAEAERAMTRVRQAFHRVDSSPGGTVQSVPAVMARKAATAAAAADTALDRLTDAAQRSLDLEEVLDLLLAARSTLDALRESADLVEMAAGLVMLAGSEPERWPAASSAPSDAYAG